MAPNTSPHEQRIVPYLAYADAPAAIAFLCNAFGFEESFRLPMPAGRIGHAEIGIAAST
jgi:PhnB protein